MVLILLNLELRNKDEKARGKLATKFLQDAINTAEQVVIRTELKDSRGKFGRVLGTVVCDGKDINQAMVDNFMAAKYFGQSKEAIEAVHMANRTRLIESGVFTPNEWSSSINKRSWLSNSCSRWVRIFIWKLINRIIDGMESKIDTVDDKVQAQLNALEERLGTKLDSQHGILVALIDRVRSLDNEIIRQDTLVKTILGVPQLIDSQK